MTDTTERPLVTVAVIPYTFEHLLRETIERAFAKTREPLGIILSDDGSPARPYKIAQDMAAACDGPHTVVPSRGEAHPGLVPQGNHVFAASSGVLTHARAGNDALRHDRVDVLHNNWVLTGSVHDIIHTSACNIDEHPKLLEVSCMAGPLHFAEPGGAMNEATPDWKRTVQ